jgi:arabinan endo-1,5-alpha-L-arabinosidase
MVDGGGTVLLESHGPVVGPGGQSVHDGVLAYHYCLCLGLHLWAGRL